MGSRQPASTSGVLREAGREPRLRVMLLVQMQMSSSIPILILSAVANVNAAIEQQQTLADLPEENGEKLDSPEWIDTVSVPYGNGTVDRSDNPGHVALPLSSAHARRQGHDGKNTL